MIYKYGAPAVPIFLRFYVTIVSAGFF